MSLVSGSVEAPARLGAPVRHAMPLNAGLVGPLGASPVLDQEEGGAGVAPPSNYRGTVALSMLDRIGCGYLVLEDRRKIVEANATARLILGREAGAVQGLDQLTSAFKRLIARAPNRPSLGPLTWIVISDKDDAPLVLNQVADDMPDGTSVVMLLDLDAHLEPNPFMLQRMFGLTMAETRLALQMARGDVPADVARSRRLSRTTIRSQLASVFAKTQTRRQAELVTLLARVAVLP
ncbi:helix-turn-helix transcriptional regulator [Bosea sp. 2KB_26]|uniref:helix-turn-helix transcriptional regulator n=1 Tax=Bosea sp. 2KB_26 TaxID=3237475 RepID=UPI0013B003F5